MHDIDKLIEAVRQDEEITAVILFGSIARDEATAVSDIDVCLVLKSGRYRAKYLSEKKLHYLKKSDFDIQIFQQLPLYIRKRILKEGKILFCRDEDDLYNIAFKTIDEYSHMERFYCEYLNEVANGGQR